MGGKKKKGLSNRLARMSDEERARYLQHRAAIEEEARRRKEQLITTYLKNKIKKEEAFTRLNIAKINENWHQILRKIKVQAQKTEIADLRLWITKVIEIKNNIILKLMKEIEDSEEQYLHNMRSHTCHINSLLDTHFASQNHLKDYYDDLCKGFEIDTKSEIRKIIETSETEERYLKTILFALEKKYNDEMKEVKIYRDSKLEVYSNQLKEEHKTMVKTSTVTMDKIWRDINTILREYLARTSARRHHYIELEHLDDRNTAERLHNERRITRYTETLEQLKEEYAGIKKDKEEEIDNLSNYRNNLHKQYFDLKQNLTKSIRLDEKKLKFMAHESNQVINYMQKINEKAKAIENIVACCQRLETEREKLMTWAKFNRIFDKFQPASISSSLDGSENLTLTRTDTKESKEDTEDIKAIIDSFSETRKIVGTTSSSIDFSPVQSMSKESSQDIISEEIPCENILERFPFVMNNITKMEGLWWSCNQVEIETMNFKKERMELLAENQNMKLIVKGILRDAALEPSPKREIVYPVKTKIKSAPSLATKIDMQGQQFLIVDL